MSNLSLTLLGEFVTKHGVITPNTFWCDLIAHAEMLLDKADSGEECEDAWQIFLAEIRDGCDELLREEKFLEYIAKKDEQCQSNGF